jgi:NADPH:quinone reductase-like Zn-dependent oxidoreductase
MQLPSSMKCIIYGRDLPLVQIRPTPPARKGHVLVRVEAVGLNPVDAKDVIGDKLPHTWTYTRSWLRSYIISKNIPGFDFAGTCVDDFQHVGDSKPFSFGDKVFGTMPPLQGTLAEYISVPIDQISSMPKNLKFEEAAALPLVGYVPFTSVSILSRMMDSRSETFYLFIS